MGKEKAKKDPGPYHIINGTTGKHLGPFTTEIDAVLARTLDVTNTGWFTGKVLNREEFEEHLSAK